MVEMAGVGLMVEVVAHELARASENSLKALDRLKGDGVPPDLRAHLSTLKAEMKSISKRVRVLDPMSVSGRQRQESFALGALIRGDGRRPRSAVCEARSLGRPRSRPQEIRVRAVKGMIVQILENLISNSLYWMDMRAERDPGYRPRISITLESGPPTITFEDNGRGIAPANVDKVFRPFFSLKETSRRRGLGLYIAQDAAEHHGGTLSCPTTSIQRPADCIDSSSNCRPEHSNDACGASRGARDPSRARSGRLVRPRPDRGRHADGRR